MKGIGRMLFTFSMIGLLTGCAPENSGITNQDFISAVDVSCEDIGNSYFLLSERFHELYEALDFDIAVPKNILLYDIGSSGGIVRLCDPSGKNCITLETRTKDDYQKLYLEYLHGVSATMTDYHNLCVFDDVVLETDNGIYQAKRFDVKIDVATQETDPESGRTLTEKRLISYWFINKNIENREETEKKRTAYLITIESTEKSVENMMKILTTFQQNQN